MASPAHDIRRLLFHNFLLICLKPNERMTFEVIADSFTNLVGNAEEYHNTVLADDKIWVFSEKYVPQKSYNWGHRVTLAGGYAIAFDTKTKTWGDKIEFPALSEEENTKENVFEFNGAVHLLMTSSFGEVSFQKLFKWTGKQWEDVALQAPGAIAASERDVHSDTVVAEGGSADRYLVNTMERPMRVYKMTSSGDDVTIKHLVDVPADVNIMHGKAVSAMHVARKVLIFFGVMGCGFRWEKNRLITYDEESNECKHIEIPGDFSDGPQFSFSGASGRGVAPNGDWLHAGGSVQVGMTGSKFEGSVWALSNLATDPEWKKMNLEIPEELSGTVVVDSNNGVIYSVGKEKVARANL